MKLKHRCQENASYFYKSPFVVIVRPLHTLFAKQWTERQIQVGTKFLFWLDVTFIQSAVIRFCIMVWLIFCMILRLVLFCIVDWHDSNNLLLLLTMYVFINQTYLIYRRSTYWFVLLQYSTTLVLPKCKSFPNAKSNFFHHISPLF